MTFRAPLCLLLLLASVSASAPALAKGDKGALKAATQAMDELFSSAKFAEARASLEGTLADCAACTPQTQAQLHADLGIVLITGLRDTKTGTAELRQARALDPGIALDPAFVSPEVQAAFNAAGRGAAVAGPPTSSAVPSDVVLEDEPSDEDKKKKKKKKHHVVEEDEAPAPECTVDADCISGRFCRAGACKAPEKPREHSAWLSFGLLQDFAFTSGTDVCSQGNQVNGGFTCVRASGSQYHGIPLPQRGGSLSGPSLGPSRFTLGTQFGVSEQLSLGLRMGYGFAGGAPTPDGGKKYLPVHAEVQGAYWLSSKAFATRGVGTFFEFSTGMAQLVGHSTVQINENTQARPPVNQIDNPPSQKVDAYQSSGLGFAGVGAGIFLPFGAGAGLLADLRLSLFFPTSGFAVGLGAGFAFGL